MKFSFRNLNSFSQWQIQLYMTVPCKTKEPEKDFFLSFRWQSRDNKKNINRFVYCTKMDELIIKNILGKKRERKKSKCCWQLDILCGQKEKDLEVCQKSEASS